MGANPAHSLVAAMSIRLHVGLQWRRAAAEDRWT